MVLARPLQFRGTLSSGGTAPTISGVSPSSGGASGGTSIVITGTNFSGVTAVLIGGSAATSFTVNSATQITATVPAHAAGAVNVAVTTASGTATASGGFTYTSSGGSAPTISSVSPGSGSTAGGDTITINGYNFGGVTAITFGGTAATSFTVSGSTAITVVTPAHAAGTVDLVVTNATGSATATNGFTFAAASTPSAPVLSRLVSSEYSNANPAFAIDIDNTPFASGDTFTLQIQVSGGNWTSLVQNVTHTITSSEDGASEAALSLSALASGTYQARAMVHHTTDSGWSNIVTWTV